MIVHPKLPPPGPSRIAIIGDRPFDGLILSTYEAALRTAGIVPDECLWVGGEETRSLAKTLNSFDPTVCLIVGNRVLSDAKSKKCSVEKWRGSLFSVKQCEGPSFKCLVTLDLLPYMPDGRVVSWDFQFYLAADLRRLKEEAGSRELRLPQRWIEVAHP